MERLKGMKMRNKWMLLIAGVILCAVAGFTHTSQAMAAGDETMDMGYLDPFTLTVTQQTTAPAADPILDMMLLGGSESSSSDYVPPAKIWVPYRPTFRSPCTPSL